MIKWIINKVMTCKKKIKISKMNKIAILKQKIKLSKLNKTIQTKVKKIKEY